MEIKDSNVTAEPETPKSEVVQPSRKAPVPKGKFNDSFLGAAEKADEAY